MKKHCIYFHKRSDGRIFYVGQSNSKVRPYSTSGRSVIWRNIIKTCKTFEVVIVHDNLTKEEANELEKKYIKEFGRLDLKTGCLANRTDGADAGTNLIFSKATRQKMSDSRRGDKNPMYGKTHTPEARKIISEAQKGRVASQYARSVWSRSASTRIRTPEEREKIRQQKLGKPRPKHIIEGLRKANSRPMVAIHDLAIMEFSSMKEVETHFGRDRKTIRQRILSGKTIDNFTVQYL